MDQQATLPPEIKEARQVSEDAREGITPEQRAKLEFDKENPEGRHRRFNVGELLPIKGAWFEIIKIDKQEMVLRIKGLTKKGAAR
jgi:hypothetical protein